jgi:RNA polymerase sigma factor (sigma-70 family)
MDRAERIRWFAREVLPHEAELRRWLSRKIRGLPHCDTDEIIQEAYARLWTVDPARIVVARAYLFVTARHVVGEVLRRSRVVSIETMADIESLNIMDGDESPERRLSGREEVERMRSILMKLPPKCRQAFELRKFEELSQREIAQRMKISESTVEKHLVKALRWVMNEMRGLEAAERARAQNNHELRRRG